MKNISKDHNLKLKNSFALVKKDIEEIKKVLKINNSKADIDELLKKLNNLKDILPEMQNIKDKFSVEIKRYKEETRLIREVLKNQEKRIKELENQKLMEAEDPKFWGSFTSLESS